MNPKYRVIISIIVVILIAVLAYAFWPAKTEAPSISVPIVATPTLVPGTTSLGLASTSVAVSYSDKGFSPGVVEVAQGGTVTFKNESSRDVWVASNDHPSHLLYSEFDAKKGYTPGSEYTFTFEKVGSWKYHDHLKASLGGIVIVK